MALPLLGVAPSPALFALLLPVALVPTWRRPVVGIAWWLTFVAGSVSAASAVRADEGDCRLHLPDGWEGVVVGRAVSRVEEGRTVPFRPESGMPGGCRQTVRLLVGGGSRTPSAGEPIRARVRWEARGHPPGGRAEWAGRLRLLGDPAPAPERDFVGRSLGMRGALQEEIARLWGDRAPMVEALVLARREHLDPETREAFAHSGTAHLLAISGFHVGVVASLLLGILRLSGMSPRRGAAGAAAGCWMYVLAIGAPHAAVRAALLLTLLVAARARGRPVVPAGALASALLILLVADPRNLASVGFQLSFAGTAGLVLLRKPLGEAVDTAWRWWRGRPLVRGGGGTGSGPGEGLLRGGADGIVAGTAATLPTLPLLAWHFDRVSLIGIPATLAVAPAVAAAIPGVGASLFLALGPDGPDRFLAGGVGLLLALVERTVRWCATLPGASIWVSRPALFGLAGAIVPSVLGLRYFFPGRVRRGVRSLAGLGAGVAVLLLLPLLPGPGALELHVIDVGQGDALALRMPSNRWILVDAGPSGERFDAGARTVVPYLRRHGAGRLEAMLLSHPHLDHVGGASAVISSIPVRGVGDPSRAVASRPWRELMVGARERGASWWPLAAGHRMTMDGVELEVLQPSRAAGADVPDDWNDLSLVVLIRFGEGTLLLTGDAGTAMEAAVLDRIPRLSVLKVGHHGSRTSTSAALLDRARPRAAVVPVGDPNGYGHPHREVLDRLGSRRIPTYRTDRDGHVRIRIHRDGSVRVRTSR